MDDGKESMEERILAIDLVEEDDDSDVGEELGDDRQKRHLDVCAVTSVTMPPDSSTFFPSELIRSERAARASPGLARQKSS